MRGFMSEQHIKEAGDNHLAHHVGMGTLELLSCFLLFRDAVRRYDYQSGAHAARVSLSGTRFGVRFS